MSRNDGFEPVGDYLVCLFDECKGPYHEGPFSSCEECPQVLYGLRGFGMSFHDSVCACKNHKRLFKFQEANAVIEDLKEAR